MLIQGESGTGKELIANLIHFNSGRGRQAVSSRSTAVRSPRRCSSPSCSVTKRARSPMRAAQRQGRFEEADGGTLFLDEIGEMSMQAQVRLLRVLQDGEFTRVGGKRGDQVGRPRHRRDRTSIWKKRSRTGTFRKDLYYRLSVFPINRCRRFASASRTFTCWSFIFSSVIRKRPAGLFRAFQKKRCGHWSITTGPVMFASLKTRSSVR